MLKKFFVVFFALLIFVSGCEKDDSQNPDKVEGLCGKEAGVPCNPPKENLDESGSIKSNELELLLFGKMSDKVEQDLYPETSASRLLNPYKQNNIPPLKKIPEANLTLLPWIILSLITVIFLKRTQK